MKKAGRTVLCLLFLLVMGGISWSQDALNLGENSSAEDELSSGDELLCTDTSPSDDAMAQAQKTRRFRKHGIMRPDMPTFLLWLKRYREMRIVTFLQEAEDRFGLAEPQEDGYVFSLLSFTRRPKGTRAAVATAGFGQEPESWKLPTT
jgi:hypothetical protein